MHRSADAELDLASGEVLKNLAGIRQRPRQTVKLRDDQRVAAAARRERFSQAGTLAVCAGQAVIDVGALGAHTE
jgi:hypothetical protein